MAGSSIAKAYVQIIPSAQGIQGKLSEVLSGEAEKAGKSSGKTLGSRLAEGLGSAASGIGKAFATAAKVGAAAFAGATAGAAAFTKSAIDAGSQFDSSMSQVAATMGVTTDQIGELRDYAMEMGAKTAFSATEAADALNYMALAGYDSSEAMEALPNVLNLAAAGNIDLAYASDMVTDAQSALGLSMDESAELVDKMAMASSKSNTSVAQLGEAILTVGGTAKNLAGGTTELSAALGILADNGVKGAEGGTALRNIILSLSAPTDTAKAAMDALGLSVFDSEGNMRSLNDIFGDLNSELSNMTQGEQTQVLNQIFNKVDLKSVNALLSNTGDRFYELSGYIDDAAGAAENMANTQLDNLAGDVTLFQSALEGAKIELSDQLTPYLRKFVQFGTDGLTEITDAFKEGGLSGAIGAAKDILRDAANTFTEEIVPALRNGFELFLTDVIGLPDEAASGIMSVLDSLGSGIATIQTALSTAIDTLRSAIDGLGVDWGGVWDGISAAVSGAAGIIGGAITGIADGFAWAVSAVQTDGTILNSVWETVCDAVNGAWELLSAAFDFIGDAVSMLAEEFQTEGTVMHDAWEALSDAIGVIGDAIGFVIDGIVAAFDYFVDDSEDGTSLLGNVWMVLGDVIAEAVGIISSAFDFIGDAFSMLAEEFQTEGTVMHDAWAALSDAIGVIGDAIGFVIDGIVAAFDYFVDDSEDGTSLLGNIWMVLGDVIAEAVGIISSVINSLGAVFGWIAEEANTDGTFINGVWTTVQTVFDTVFGTISDIFGAFAALFHGDFEGFGQGLLDAGSTFLGGLGDVFSSAWSAIGSAVSTAWNAISGTISSAAGGIKDAVVSKWNETKRNNELVWNAVKDKTSSIWSSIKTTVGDKASSIKSSVADKFGAVKTTAINIWDSIKSAISDKISAAKDAVSGAIEKIKGFFKFEWSLPKLKMPHLNITGSFSLAPPSVPKFSIDWYSKAMDYPMLLKSPTIFGAAGGTLLGGGEAGDEIVGGASTLMGMMRSAVGGELAGGYEALEDKLDRLLELLSRLTGVSITINGTDYRSKMELAEAIIDLITREKERRAAAFG